MLVEELDIDPKIALRESVSDLNYVKADLARLDVPEPIEVEYRFEFNQSKAEGRKFQNQIKRLAKLAFDGQCRNVIRTITANNGSSAQGKVRDFAEKINSFTSMLDVRITEAYVRKKVGEANVAWKTKVRDANRKAAEREEREILRKERQLERENQLLIKDAEKAAKDETLAQDMLQKAREELQQAHGAELTAIRQNVERIEQALKEAQAKNERAKSMAQLTRAGHVYIISNTGSFGENVFKIGLTRRLDPEDRVNELGDASVPFKFDTHAMIWSVDAPALEAELHKVFSKKRLNLVNNRREFFCVSLDEIKQELARSGINAQIESTAFAEEYRESKRLRPTFECGKGIAINL